MALRVSRPDVGRRGRALVRRILVVAIAAVAAGVQVRSAGRLPGLARVSFAEGTLVLAGEAAGAGLKELEAPQALALPLRLVMPDGGGSARVTWGEGRAGVLGAGADVDLHRDLMRCRRGPLELQAPSGRQLLELPNGAWVHVRGRARVARGGRVEQAPLVLVLEGRLDARDRSHRAGSALRCGPDGKVQPVPWPRPALPWLGGSGAELELPNPSGPPEHAALAAMLRVEEERDLARLVELAAAGGLGRRARLLAVALEAGGPSIRAAAARELTVGETIELRDVLRKALGAADPEDRPILLRALARAGDLEALPWIADEEAAVQARLATDVVFHPYLRHLGIACSEARSEEPEVAAPPSMEHPHEALASRIRRGEAFEPHEARRLLDQAEEPEVRMLVALGLALGGRDEALEAWATADPEGLLELAHRLELPLPFGWCLDLADFGRLPVRVRALVLLRDRHPGLLAPRWRAMPSGGGLMEHLVLAQAAHAAGDEQPFRVVLAKVLAAPTHVVASAVLGRWADRGLCRFKLEEALDVGLPDPARLRLGFEDVVAVDAVVRRAARDAFDDGRVRDLCRQVARRRARLARALATALRAAAAPDPHVLDLLDIVPTRDLLEVLEIRLRTAPEPELALWVAGLERLLGRRVAPVEVATLGARQAALALCRRSFGVWRPPLEGLLP